MGWDKEFPKKNISNGQSINVMDYLKGYDMGKLLNHVVRQDPDMKKYGLFLKIATTSNESIRAILASSFCKRINYVANQVLNKGNSIISDEDINMLDILIMKKEFMIFVH